MRKFLRLVEENTPGVSYIVEIKDPDGTLLGSAAIPDNANTSFYEEVIRFIAGHGGEVVAVNSRPPAEDQEIKSGGPDTYDVDKEINKLASKAKGGALGLAGKMLGTGAQQAKAAVKKREKVSKDAINVYKKDTQSLKQAIQQAS